MTKSKFSHKVIAVFLTLNFLNTIVPYNLLLANNNGPKAPEAGGFEPIDATDMVNFLTGDFSYVLPLLNVPSPEGGYPISLAYHAGIALDQEAAWTGLGWNLNPGVINRTVNGFPDDYNNTTIYEHFYDEGGVEETFTAGIGYTNATGASVGLNFSWGTNKAFGGSVTFGYGIPLGEGAGTLGINGSLGQNNSIGVGYQPLGKDGGLSFGASINDQGTFGGSVGVQGAENSGGFNISANSAGQKGFGISFAGKNSSVGLNVSLSKNGVGIQGTVRKASGGSGISGIGTGLNLSFANTIEQGDYTINQSGWTIPLIVPLLDGGSLSAFFGKQRIEWFLNNTESSEYTGSLNYNAGFGEGYQARVERFNSLEGRHIYYSDWFETSQEATDNYNLELNNCQQEYPNDSCSGGIRSNTVRGNMDVYQFPLSQVSFYQEDENNIIFPNFDNFNITAQGLSGTMSHKYFENGSLFGVVKELTELDLSYRVARDLFFTFENTSNFYIENNFSTYLGISPASFNTANNLPVIGDYHATSNPSGMPRRKVSNFVEYFTNDQIHNYDNPNYSTKFLRGYIEPSQFSEVSNPEPDGIGAFAITNSEGKTYHYSIPVYNHVISTRNIGGIKEENGAPKEERNAYFERLQDTPYATHWLLTAVTGPDYIDMNNNHKVDNGDYGYWVELDYGKWSEAYGWKTPYGEEYAFSKDDDDFKSQTKGFKEIWYLDAIKTRTHTAIFSKSLRSDDLSYEWVYKSIDWTVSDQDSDDFTTRFTLPKQPSLKLDKIFLFKNETIDGLTKSSGNLNGNTPGSRNIAFERAESVSKTYNYKRENHVYDHSDISDDLVGQAIKVVDLEYQDGPSSLVRETPNTLNSSEGRLTLSKVYFNGKGNTPVLPPYHFDYHNDRNFDAEKRSAWGYYEDEPWMWSLKSILSPEGSQINIGYESDDFYEPVLQNGRLFTRYLKFELLNAPPLVAGSTPEAAPKGLIDIKISIDELETDGENIVLSDYFDPTKTFYMDMWHSAVYNDGYPGYDRSSVDIEGEQAEIINWNPADNEMTIRVLASSPFYRDTFQFNVNPFSIKGAKISIGDWNIYKKNQKKGRYQLAWIPNSGGWRYSLMFNIIGNKKVYKQIDGDLRVANIEITDGITTSKSIYKYHQLGFDEDNTAQNYRSSGTVSYIPDEDNNPIPYASELPAPKVMYEYVTVENVNNNEDSYGKSIYHFNVMKEKSEDNLHFGDFLNFEVNQTPVFYNSTADRNVDIAAITVNDNLASIGQLLDVATYNNNGHLLNSTSNEYFNMENRIDNQGVDQQSYQTYKSINYKEGIGKTDKWIINSSTRRNYAQALKKTTTTSGSHRVTSSYDRYDEVTGHTLETTTISSKGTTFKTKIVPAYTIPEYSGSTGGFGMGSKVDDITNKNMLSQNAASFTYKIDENDNEKILSSTINTWNNNWIYRNRDGTTKTPNNSSEKVWRKHQNYVWKGELNEDGTYNGYTGEYDGFNWAYGATQQDQWQKISETTLYDHYSMPLENTDINGNYASTKMDKEAEKIFSTANAAYTEQFYSGAEEGTTGPVGGEVRLWNPVQDYAHTGFYSEKAGVSSTNFRTTVMPIFNEAQLDEANNSGTSPSEKYKVSVWVHKDNYEQARLFNGNELIPFSNDIVFAGDWIMLNQYLDISNPTEIYVTSNNGFVYFDDFRVHPMQSSMSSFVYNDWDELTHIIGANNMGIRYEYDDAGRLIYTFNEVADTPTTEGGFKLAAEYNQNYKREISDGNGGDSSSEFAVYFDNLNGDCGEPRSEAILNGPAGAVVTLQMNPNGTPSPTVQGSAYGISPSAEIQTVDVTIPQGGSIPVWVKFIKGTNGTNDCEGIVTLTIIAVVNDLGSPQTAGLGTSLSFGDQDFESCGGDCDSNDPPPMITATIGNEGSINGSPPSCSGQYLSNLSAVSGGSGNYSYTWYRQLNGGSWTPLGSTGTSATYNYNPLATGCGGTIRFRCRVDDNESTLTNTFTSPQRSINCSCNPQ